MGTESKLILADKYEADAVGMVLLTPSLGAQMRYELAPSDFGNSQLRAVWKAICECVDSDSTPDLGGVALQLKRNGDLDAIGGQPAIARYLDSVYAYDVKNAISAIREASNLRKLDQVAKEISGQVAAETEPDEILQQAQKKLTAIATNTDIDDHICTAREAMEWVLNNPQTSGGLTTGLYDLNALIGGLEPGRLILVAGRPSMGKSALSNCFASNAIDAGKHVATFTLEGSRNELVTRLMSSATKTESYRIARGQLTAREKSELAKYLRDSQVPDRLTVVDKAGLSLGEFESIVRRLRSQKRLDLVVLDYLQLVNPGTDEGNRAVELGRISRRLKTLALELEIPIVALAQLSRAVEARTNKRPMLSDLRESGNLEQDADQVIMLYREEYYNPDTVDRGVAELIVAKNRHGGTGTAKVLFEPQYTRFVNMAIKPKEYAEVF